jgi:hypothetical protein
MIFLIFLIAMRNIWNQKIIKITRITVQTKFLRFFVKIQKPLDIPKAFEIEQGFSCKK